MDRNDSFDKGVTDTLFDVVIVGAGPTGLACGVHARRNGLKHLVIDRGTLVNTIVGYPTQTTFFSTPERLSLAGIPFSIPGFRPSRTEAIAYYRGVALSEQVELALNTEVERVDCDNAGCFHVATDRGIIRSKYVVIATGYFDNTNRLQVLGEELPHVHHYYREAYPYFRQNVLVIGGRNSAVEAALDLYRNGANVTLIHRGDRLGDGVKYWIRPDIENRMTSGEIKVRWNTEVESIREDSVTLRNNVTGKRFDEEFDAIFAMIGYRPDAVLLEACGIQYDNETLIPQFDSKTLESNVHNLFIAGSVACGCQTWEIFIENGREHAEIVINEIVSRLKNQEPDNPAYPMKRRGEQLQADS